MLRSYADEELSALDLPAALVRPPGDTGQAARRRPAWWAPTGLDMGAGEHLKVLEHAGLVQPRSTPPSPAGADGGR